LQRQPFDLAEFAELLAEIDPPLRRLFDTAAPVVIYTASGTGGWEAALVNTLSPGDTVLAFDNGHFATLWRALAENLGLRVEFVPGSWRRGVDPDEVQRRLSADATTQIKAVMVVHNETSTGVTSRVQEVRRAIDIAGHPALLLVDTISSLGSIDYHHDAWGVDVTVAGSQKGMMLPPGLAFNAVSERALAASAAARLPRSYWDWQAIIAANKIGAFPSTPSTNLLYGLCDALHRLEREGRKTTLARHARHAHATRCAVQAWGLELLCEDPSEYSNSLTAVLLDESHDADALREIVLERFDLSLGAGLGRLAGRVFRIGHLGDLNDLMLLGTLCGVEMGLRLVGCPVRASGVAAAMAELETSTGPLSARAV